jgi:hypothetical protein
VQSPLRLADDEVPAEQLEVLAGMEDAQVNEPIVLGASPAAHLLG